MSLQKEQVHPRLPSIMYGELLRGFLPRLSAPQKKHLTVTQVLLYNTALQYPLCFKIKRF